MKNEQIEIKMECPKCHAKYSDHDGFGVIYCPKCKYCTHASITGEVCGFCKKIIPNKQIEKMGWEKEFNTRWGISEYPWEASELDQIKSFIRSLLASQKQEIVNKLPKERILNKDNPQYVLGWNACLFWVKDAIEKIKRI